MNNLASNKRNEDFIPQVVLDRFYRYKLQVSLPIILVCDLFFKNLLLISLGEIRVIELMIFDLLAGIFLIYYAIRIDKKANMLVALPTIAFFTVFSWIIDLKRRKEVRILHLTILFFLFFYSSNYGKIDYSISIQPIIFFPFMFGIVLFALIFFGSIITIISLNKDQIQKEIKINF